MKEYRLGWFGFAAVPLIHRAVSRFRSWFVGFGTAFVVVFGAAEMTENGCVFLDRIVQSLDRKNRKEIFLNANQMSVRGQIPAFHFFLAILDAR